MKMAEARINCDLSEARFRCEYCGCEVKYTISVESIFRHLAVQCPRVPEERAWRIAGRLSAIERDGDAQQAALAHLFKHPQDFGRTIYVVLGPSIGKPLSVTTVASTKENALWLEWTKVKEK
jgi:hypothetical protein